MTVGHTYAMDDSVAPADNAALVRKMALLHMPNGNEQHEIAKAVEADRRAMAAKGVII